MGKFTFKMKDRMKIVVERVAANSFTLTVSGKTDTTFRFSKKRAVELVNELQGVLTYGTSTEFEFNKTMKSPAGCIRLEQPEVREGFYTLTVHEEKNRVFCESDISRKNLKKMIKTIKEVYEIE